jgi:dipeptidyl aminopeptidase/acylaminoacyl peptidase
VRVFGKTTGAAYVLVDLDGKKVTRVGNLYAGIESADIAAVKPISYAASDGMQINGYLTLPNGKATRNLPLIVMPHGGPASRDDLSFDWFAQALASRGYLVLQPNFRGSEGLGQKVEEAGYGEWGRKMQTDLSDGVRALTKLGIADPNKVCIVGASYGGYAALAGATLDADVYRCAVSVAGISDLKELLESSTYSPVLDETRSFRYLLRYLGAVNAKDPVVAGRSPLKHVQNVKNPILLIHGDNDSVVPLSQSQDMSDALRKAGKPHEFVKLKLEDHWLSKADTRLQMLQAVVKFLEVNNPP